MGIARVNGLFERQSGANRARLESGDRVWTCDPCQAEEGLRGRHRLLSPVVAEHELAPAIRLTMHLLALSSGVAARPRVHLLRDGFVHCRRARDGRGLVIRGSKERLFVAEALLTRRHCPLFVRVVMPTGPNQRRRWSLRRPGFIGVNWEELMPLPTRQGLENHCTGNGAGGSNPSPSANPMTYRHCT